MSGVALPLGPLGRLARAAFWLGAAYWLVYVLVAPVTTIDAQMYNLARLELAARGGFFNSDAFTSVFHVIFPWAYDAVHFPFMGLGWGFALPGFFCLMGTAYVAFVLIRDRWGEDAAWVAAASLLALPCLVYQGSSTKNDIALLFCGAVWTYGAWRWQREGRGWHLAWMVLAITFMIGAKTTGVIYGSGLALATLWLVRHRRDWWLRIGAGLLAAGVLFGSVETYVESARLFGHPLGPPALIRRLGNQDGLAGGAANLVRHLAGAIYVGPTDFNEGQVAAWNVANGTRRFLAAVGLGDAGLDPRLRGRPVFLSQSGLEELSGFGALGMLAMFGMLAATVYWRPRSWGWRLRVLALFGIALVGATVAFSGWTNRYLIGWFALATLGLVVTLWETNHALARTARWLVVFVIVAGIVAAPLQSFNRRPVDIVMALRDRERLETSTYPIVGAVRERLRAWRAAEPATPIYCVVSDEAVILPLLTDRKLAAVFVTPAILRRLAAEHRLPENALVVVENAAGLPDFLVPLETVTARNLYSLDGTIAQHICRVRLAR